MSVEEKLDELITQIKADRKQSNKDRYENLMYIAWGFALGTLGLAVARISVTATIGSIIITVIFALIGWYWWYKGR